MFTQWKILPRKEDTEGNLAEGGDPEVRECGASTHFWAANKGGFYVQKHDVGEKESEGLGGPGRLESSAGLCSVEHGDCHGPSCVGYSANSPTFFSDLHMETDLIPLGIGIQ